MRKRFNVSPARRFWHFISTPLLILAVLASILFTFLIWFGSPIPVQSARNGFYTSPKLGAPSTLTRLFLPHQVWLWTGHQQLYSYPVQSSFVSKLLSALHGATTVTVTPAKTAKARGGASYLELDYATYGEVGSPIQELFPSLTQALSVRNVYIKPGAKRDTVNLVVVDQQGAVFNMRASGVRLNGLSLTEPDASAVPYAQIPINGRELRLPYTNSVMPIEIWSLKQQDISGVIDSYFADPSAVIPIVDSIHKTLYTDGLRAVWLSSASFGPTIAYRNPQTGNVIPRTGHSPLDTAVQFINDHGGFLSNQTSQGISAIKRSPDMTEIIFSLSEDGFPVFGQFGSMQCIVNNGWVVTFRRALVEPSILEETQPLHILSGVQLISRLSPRELNKIRSIKLGYGTTLFSSAAIEFFPVYQITFTSGTIYVKATDGQVFHGTGMTSWTSVE